MTEKKKKERVMERERKQRETEMRGEGGLRPKQTAALLKTFSLYYMFSSLIINDSSCGLKA